MEEKRNSAERATQSQLKNKKKKSQYGYLQTYLQYVIQPTSSILKGSPLQQSRTIRVYVQQ
jgi:hypothetical protein